MSVSPLMRSSLLLPLLSALLLAGTLAGCGSDASAPAYRQEVIQERVQRDMQMREKNSVVPPRRRDAFRGLDYYAVDTTYRHVVPLERRARPDTVMMAQSTGGMDTQVRIGRVTVPMPSGARTLAVFRGASDDPRGRLWIPFADATNEDSTYSGGRYVDLRSAPGDSVEVDFNRAYNPTCAYNPEFACPLPPPQNQLEVPVPAGEKRPQFAGGAS